MTVTTANIMAKKEAYIRKALFLDSLATRQNPILTNMYQEITKKGTPSTGRKLVTVFTVLPSTPIEASITCIMIGAQIL